jgi:hypothetical protein
MALDDFTLQELGLVACTCRTPPSQAADGFAKLIEKLQLVLPEWGAQGHFHDVPILRVLTFLEKAIRKVTVHQARQL